MLVFMIMGDHACRSEREFKLMSWIHRRNWVKALFGFWLTLAIVVGALPAAQAGVRSEAAASPTRVLLLGDSLTHGSSGDYSWRYWFWTHFSTGQVDFVGPRSDLNNMYTHDGDDTTDHTYVNPAFDQDHAAKSGRTLADGVDMITSLSQTYKPDVVSILLGINDISLNAAPADVESRLRTVISRARAVNSKVKVSVGLLLPQVGLSGNPDWESRRVDANSRIRSVVSSMTTATSPIAIAETTSGFKIPDDVWDGVHLNAKGEVKVAAAFSRSFATLGVGSPMSTLPTPVPQPIPGTPTLTATAGDGKVEIKWNRPANAYNFIIEVNHPGIGWSVFPIAMNTLSWTVDSLTNGAQYQFRVTPVGKSGTGTSSNIASATPTGPAPGAVTATVSVKNGSDVVVNWNTVAHQTGSYIWTRDLTGDGQWKRSAWSIFNGWTPYTMPGMLKGADYEIKVQPSNGLITGPTSSAVRVHTTGPAPSAPTLSASAVDTNQINGNFTNLSWGSSSNANAYYIQIRDVTQGEAWKQSSLPTWDTKFRAGWMMGGHQYQYRVVPYNDYVAGTPSNAITVTAPNPYPSAPADDASVKAYNSLSSKDRAIIIGWVNLMERDFPGTWQTPGTQGYEIFTTRMRAIIDPLTFGDLVKAIAPTFAAAAVAAVGIALCPETGGATCAAVVGAASGFVGQCVADCNDAASLAMMTIIGGVAGYGAGWKPGGVGAAGDPLLPGLPTTAPKPLGLGSTGRVTPNNITEQLAMTQVRANPQGKQITGISMGDSRWPAEQGWVKMQQIVSGVNIHYVRNTVTHAVDDFKFK